MKAFVAGATGLTGRFVVQALCENGVSVVAHVRPDSPRLSEWTDRFVALGARVDSTPWELKAMQEGFKIEKPDLVFALLGTTKKRQTTQGDGDYMAVDFGLTALLIDALHAQPTTRFVYLSAIGSKEGVRSAYMKARWLAEEHLRQSRLPYLIARPSFIFGDRDEARLGERWVGGAADALIGAVGLLGARRFAKRVGSIQGRELGYGLVREALAWPEDGRVLTSEGLR